MLDPVIMFVTCVFLALLWLVASWQKLAAFEVFAATLADYRIVPAALLRSCVIVIIASELLLAVMLIVPGTRSASLIGSAALLLIYSLAMSVNLLRGRRYIDCGCMGSAARQSLSGWLVVRNCLLAVAAVSAVAVTPRPLIWLDAITISGGVIALAFVYSAFNRLIANAPDLAQLRRQ